MASPTDCRNNALRCIEMANETLDQHLQATLFDLSMKWMRLARKLEDDVTAIEQLRDVSVIRLSS
jgi:hypothetical protein